MKINDRIRIKNTRAYRTGTIVGIWESDFYIENSQNERILFAVAGEYKVQLDGYEGDNIVTFSESEIILINN